MNISFYLHDERDPKALESQLLWLGKRYRFVSWKEIYDFYYNGKSLKNTCHITIDDGWLSTYSVIFPVLRKLGIPASIFVSPRIVLSEENFWYFDITDFDKQLFKEMIVELGYFKEGVKKYPLDLILKEFTIDDVTRLISEFRERFFLPKKERGFMNLEELKELDASGLIEVGAHTMIHPVLANETDERSRYEITESIKQLSNLLHKEINIFAYPNGLYGLDFGKREMSFLSETSVKLGFSVDPGTYSLKQSPYNIPRVCSLGRLRLGRLGLVLPSMHDQEKPRMAIKQLKLK